MMAYRYLNEQHALELLQTKKWKVGRLLELNDPADCQPTLWGAPMQASDEATAAFESKYLSGIYEDIGVLCFSGVISDPVISSHYADSHRGMAIGYDFQPSGARLYEVQYQEERATLDYNEAQLLRPNGETTQAFIEKVITHGFTRKAPSWSYEKEFRIFTHLAHCRMEGAHYFLSSGGAPNRVVLGLRCKTTEADVRGSFKTVV